MDCNLCDKKATCKKPCEAIEKVLRESGIRGKDWYGSVNSKRYKNFRQHNEIAFSNLPYELKQKMVQEGKMGEEFL